MYNNGDRFDGAFENDQAMLDKGKYYYGNGDVYEGLWSSNGLRHGRGTCTYRNGDIYTGEWRDGVREGDGVLVQADGTKYSGAWLNDRQHGEGVIYYQGDDEPYRGTWRDGRMDDQSDNILLAPLKMREQEVRQLEATLEEEKKKNDDVEPANRCTICDRRRINTCV